MPTLPAPYLQKVAAEVLKAAGTPDHEAATVAQGLVAANLAGHDSHGLIQLPIYVDRIQKGHIVPGAPIQVERDTPTTARVKGNWGFGFVVTRHAVDLAIRKAQQYNIAAVTIYQQSHIGRLAPYPLMAVEHGMAAMMFTDSGRGPKAVAPFGGRARRLGTNPLCIAVPSNQPSPVFLDMATAAVAANKLLLAQSRRQQVPPGWIIDRDGNPSTDPAAYASGGALLPLGGDQAYKGYGLSFMVEVFSGLLTTLGFGLDPQGRHNDGCFFLCWKVDAFMPLDEFKQQVSDFIAFIKTSPPAAGASEVLYPGEIEHRTTQHRLQHGIEVEDDTWQAIQALITRYHLAPTLGAP